MKINRQSFIKILQSVRPGLATKELVENSTSFIFVEGEVMTYNDEICVSHPVKGLEEFGAVQAKELLALLNKLPDEEIELEAKDQQLLVRGSKTKAGIRRDDSCNTDEIFNALGELKDWKPLPSTFIPAVSFCLFSVGKEANKPLLTCVYVGGDCAMSSDNARITWYDLGEGFDMACVNIPSVAIKELKNFNPTEYTQTTGWIHFRTADDVIFSCRTISGQYPHEKIMSIIDGVKGNPTKLPTGLNDTLERAGIFTDGGKDQADNRIKVKLTDGNVSVRGEGNAGWLEESARVRYKGDDIEFDVSPSFLQQILNHTDEVIIGSSVLKFEGEQFIHLVSVLAPKKA